MGKVGTWKCVPFGYLMGVMLYCLHQTQLRQCLAMSLFMILQWYTCLRAAYIQWNPLWPEWSWASGKTGPIRDDGSSMVLCCSMLKVTMVCKTPSFRYKCWTGRTFSPQEHSSWFLLWSLNNVHQHSVKPGELLSFPVTQFGSTGQSIDWCLVWTLASVTSALGPWSSS